MNDKKDKNMHMYDEVPASFYLQQLNLRELLTETAVATQTVLYLPIDPSPVTVTALSTHVFKV